MRPSSLPALPAALSTLLAACGPVSPPAGAGAGARAGDIAVRDGLEREVRLSAPARRIVSTVPSNTEIVFAVGAGDRLVGRDRLSDHPPEAAAVRSIGGAYPKVNAEAIIDLEPDLVLAPGVLDQGEIARLSDLGLTVYAAHHASRVRDIFEDVIAVGALAGAASVARDLVARLEARIGEVRGRVEGLPRPRVFYEMDATDPARPFTPGRESFIDDLISLAGAVNVGAVGEKPYYAMSLERLILEDPDLIILGSATYGNETPESVARRPGWGGLRAVRAGAVHSLDDRLVSRPGPRVVDGIEALARLFHPAAFP
jgi:iron complex transport system substrate-binding protein